MTGWARTSKVAALQWAGEVTGGWNRFWFTPTDPATLCVVRILAGAMLLYTHLVWSLRLTSFHGPQAWISGELWTDMQSGSSRWSLFHLADSNALTWALHLFALAVFFCLMIGAFTRVTSVLSYLLMLSYLHRAEPALFGLDQINTVMAMYLMIGPAGARYSFDSWWKRRRSRDTESAERPLISTSANVALRLMQLHMCVIYFYAATRKLTGESWWDGSAMWFAFGNLEYQSIPMTWLADWPVLIVIFTHVTIIWELGYAALIWPRMTRGIMLIGAVVLHLGIAIFLGMATFGLAMLIGNLAFLPASFTRGVMERHRPDPAV